MTVTLVLLAVFVLTGYVLPAILGAVTWPRRAPRLGVAAWLTAAVATSSAAVLALFSAAVPFAALGHGLAEWWQSCLENWQHYYGGVSRAGAGIAAGATALLLARFFRAALLHRRSVVSVRREQIAGLALFTPVDGQDVVVLPHSAPAAYCIPGKHGCVVMTDGAVRLLAPDQMRAVLAHERAHLTGRHSYCVGLATVLKSAFGPLAPVFTRAERETMSLVEMAADDAALHLCASDRLVDALLRLASGGSPATTFAAAGSNLVARIERLYSLPRPLSRLHRLAGFVSIAAVLILPIVTVVAAVAAAVIAASCPPSV